MKRETAPTLHPIPMISCLMIDCFHQQEFELIRRTQIAWDTALCYGMFPQNFPPLPSKVVPGLLIIINDGLIETALQLFQRHASCLSCGFSVVDAIARVGHA